jgi:hypothetical protein
LLEFRGTAVTGVAGAEKICAADLPASRLDWRAAGERATESAAATIHGKILTNPRHGYPSVTAGSCAGHHDLL